jgi:type II secretory pathway component PulF
MLAAGIALSDTISVTNKRTVDPTEKTLINKLLHDISGGQSFSDARKSVNVKIDSNMYRIILVGESRGNLAIGL